MRLSAAQHSDCQILRILTKYGNLVALAHRRYTVLHNVMGMEEIIRNKSVHLQFNWKERGPEHDVWTRVGEGKRGRSSKVKEGKSSFKKSVYRESGNLGAAAVWDSVWGKKMD